MARFSTVVRQFLLLLRSVRGIFQFRPLKEPTRSKMLPETTFDVGDQSKSSVTKVMIDIKK